jgi:hypothetical protein
MPTLMCRTEWKIFISAALHRVIQEERPDSCKPVALKFVVHLLTLVHFSDVVLKAAVRTICVVLSRNYYVRTLFLCDCSSFYSTLLLLHPTAQRLWKDGW